MVSQQKVLGQGTLALSLTPHTNTYTKWVTDTRVKQETTKLLGKKQEKNLQDLGARQRVLRLDTESMNHERKN